MSIDLSRLQAWLDQARVGETGSPVAVQELSGGSQNAIYEVRRDGLHGVLRIPPRGAPADRDRGILREWTILRALEGTDVPHTAPIALCEDTEVLGRPFYVMGHVDGWSLAAQTGVWPAPFDSDTVARQGIGLRLMEGVALLGNVDWRGRGLDGLGRPEGFHDRQVERWSSFLERVRARDLPGFDEAAAWLAARRPLDYRPGLMHGDYGFANVMFGHGAPASLAAVIDWEMTTIGDPKLDLGWVLQSWPAAAAEAEGTIWAGMPLRAEMADQYASVSGRQVDDLDYYLVLAKWKLGVVLEQGYQRAGDDEKLQSFGPMVLDLMAGAAEIAESSDYVG